VEYTALYRGKRHYELSNHLGNVQVVISDKRVSICDEYLAVERFEAEVLSAVDYYPFGKILVDRQWYANNDSNALVNGFGGMRYDHEINGHGRKVDYGARILDVDLGRWMSVDPFVKKFPSESPYQFAGCSPFQYIDIGGASKYKVVRIVNEATGEEIVMKKLVDTETLTRVAGTTNEDNNATQGWEWCDVHEVTQITIRADGMIITEELDDEPGAVRTTTPSWKTSSWLAGMQVKKTESEKEFDNLKNSDDPIRFGIMWMSSRQRSKPNETRKIKSGDKMEIDNIDYLFDAVTGYGKTPGIDIPKKYLSQPTLEALYYLAKAMDVNGEIIGKGIDLATWVQEQQNPAKQPTLIYEDENNTAPGIESGKKVKYRGYSDGTTTTDTVPTPE